MNRASAWHYGSVIIITSSIDEFRIEKCSFYICTKAKIAAIIVR